jgi:cytochrome c556
MKVGRDTTRIVGFALLIGSVVIISRMSPSLASRIDAASAEAPQAHAGQQVVLLAPIERDIVKKEMRTILRSLSLILQGLAVSDLEMVEQAARLSGNTAAIEPELAAKLPTHFAELDTKLHTRFDQLADTIKTGTRGDLLKRVAALTGYCVACHEMYRFEERR